MNGEAAGYFLDTSALAKSYHREVGTDRVEQLLDQPGSTIFISRLTTIEIQSSSRVECARESCFQRHFSCSGDVSSPTSSNAA